MEIPVKALAPAWRRFHGALQRRLIFLAGGRFSRFCRPVFIAFLLTERCNAHCVHCDIWKNKGKEDSPEIEEWKKVLWDLRKWLGPVGIVFTGGEALLSPHAMELVRYAISLGFSLEVLTHGYWSDQSRIESLALSDPWRITVSLDGLGAVHSKIRGREDFFEITSRTIDTLIQMRDRHRLTYKIQLKTVIMDHNLDDLSGIARFATRHGMDVCYQPIEQNYNTRSDPLWFHTSANWPRDTARAVRCIQELAALKRGGLHIANSKAQLEAMIRYFQDPAGLRLVTQAHVAHVRRVPCCAMTTLQFQANGDVTVCSNRPPIGNIRTSPIRQLWKRRSWVWADGCCLAAGSETGVEPLAPRSASEAGAGSR
jgi:MoaA/NifB/PqqE/SkfB family radical SAM enzyme